MFKNKTHPRTNLRLIELTRQRRREMTQAEKILWSRIRNRRFKGMKFQRKHHLPHSMMDFHCPEHNLIIEVDCNVCDSEDRADATRILEDVVSRVKVLRFTNHQILGSMENVLKEIELQIT